MEKDIGKIPKNNTTDIIVRLDDFAGRKGLTIREFVTSERYTGFTKAGVKIPAEHLEKFKEMVNSISEESLKEEGSQKTLDEEIRVENPEELPDY